MIQSMTAFARTQTQGNWGSAVCELRSINHRYLELSVRLPDALHPLESILRERIREHIKRGKIECYFRYQPGTTGGAEISTNEILAKNLCAAVERIAQFTKNSAPINPFDVINWPGVLQIAEIDLEIIEDEIVKLLEESLTELVKTRAREGEELKHLFLERLDAMKTEIAKVRAHIPEILKNQRERIMLRVKDVKLELDSHRLEQELVLFAQKIDVTEELDRLDTHISEVRRVLKHGGVVGRRLDFLMQELNREANTLGSKSVDVETTRVSVELKVLIEQIREQVQNIE